MTTGFDDDKFMRKGTRHLFRIQRTKEYGRLALTLSHFNGVGRSASFNNKVMNIFMSFYYIFLRVHCHVLPVFVLHVF